MDGFDHLLADGVWLLLGRTPDSGGGWRQQGLIGVRFNPGPPRSGAIGAKRVAMHKIGDPCPGDPRGVQHGESGAVVLKPQAPRGTPDGLQLIIRGQSGSTRSEQATEADVAACGCGLLEQEERRHLRAVAALMPIEDVAEQRVAAAWRFVKFLAGMPV